MTQSKFNVELSIEDEDAFDVTQMADAAFESFAEVFCSQNDFLLRLLKFYCEFLARKFGCYSNTQHNHQANCLHSNI